MNPGEVPPELAFLTYIEQTIIALVCAIISFYKIKEAQYKYSGLVINLYKNLDDFAEELPR